MFGIRKDTWGVIGVTVVILILGFSLPQRTVENLAESNVPAALGALASGSEGNDDLKSVDVALAASFDARENSVSVIGTLQAVDEATLRAETGGVITRVGANLGQFVGRGTVIAQVQNSREWAGVVQAEGVYDAALANLDNLKNGARSESQQISQSRLSKELQSLDEAKRNALISLDNVYNTADAAIRGQVDTFFRDGQFEKPKLIFNSVSTVTQYKIETDRTEIERRLDSWYDELQTITIASDLDVVLLNRANDLEFISVFLDEAAGLINLLKPHAELSQTTINTWKGAVEGARGSINGALLTLLGARERLNAQDSLVEITRQELAIAETGGDPDDVRAAEAALKQAEGALGLARASYEKTLVRAPFSGTIIELPIETGDFVAMFDQVGRISGTTGLEVQTYLSENATAGLSVGDLALVEDLYAGRISRISPALDSRTKRVEVLVALDDDVDLINGQLVRVNFNSNSENLSEVTEFAIPISALKISAGKNYVFTIGEDDRLIAHEVKIGAPLGDRIIIKAGVTADQVIVTDARGLKDGQQVTVNR